MGRNYDEETELLEIGLTSKNPEVKIWQAVNIHGDYESTVVNVTFCFKETDTMKLLEILTSQEDSDISVRLSRRIKDGDTT